MTRSAMALAVVGCSIVTSLPAQRPSADSARALMAGATRAASGSTPEGYREAIRLRTAAAAIFHGLADPRGEGEALAWLAEAWLHLGEADSGRRIATGAVRLRLEGGDTVGATRTLAGVLGPALERLGQGDSALAVYHRSRVLADRLGDPRHQVWPAQNIGAYYLDRSELDSALTWFHRAAAFGRQAGDHKGVADNLLNVSLIFQQLGNADSALAYARQGMRIGIEQSSDSIAAPALLNLGVILSALGGSDSALHYYRLAATAADRAPMPQTQRDARLNVAIVMVQLGQGDSARVYFDEVLRRSREVKDASTEARALNSLGILFIERKQLDSASAVYRTVLDTYRALDFPAGEGSALVNLAKVFVLQNLVDSALPYLRSAYSIGQRIQYPALMSVALNQLSFLFTVQGKGDSALSYVKADLQLSREIKDARGVGASLTMIALLAALGRDFGTAVAYFDSAATLKSGLSLQAGGDFNRTSLGEKEFELYDVWAKAWLERSRQIGPSLAAAGALGASERGRAQALLDLMGGTSETEARPDLPAWARTLVASATRGGNSLLIYHATPDTLLAWTAGPGIPLAIHAIPVARDSLTQLVGQLRHSMGLGAEDGRMVPEDEQDRGAPGEAAGPWTDAAQALAQVLLPRPIRQALRSSRDILVIPHGPVALVPFTILPWRSAGRVFSDSAALRYSPSLGTAIAAESREIKGARSSALIVGNPRMPSVELRTGFQVPLNPLPKAELEAKAIGTQLGSRVVEGAGTTETAIRGSLPSAAVVHLATHGFAYSSEARARSSYLALTPDSLNDGLLTVGEILDDPALTLSADLVALSACQTGLGDLKRAEGTIGLQRAFLAKGARSVLVSLWSVSDEGTRLLMERFYSHWLGDTDHPDKAESLRRAQQDVRKHPGFEHPRYWAAFQLVGAR